MSTEPRLKSTRPITLAPSKLAATIMGACYEAMVRAKWRQHDLGTTRNILSSVEREEVIGTALNILSDLGVYCVEDQPVLAAYFEELAGKELGDQ